MNSLIPVAIQSTKNLLAFIKAFVTYDFNHLVEQMESLLSNTAEPGVVIKPFMYSREYRGVFMGHDPAYKLQNLSTTTDRMLALVYGAFPADNLFLTKDTILGGQKNYYLGSPFSKPLILSNTQTDHTDAAVAAVAASAVLTSDNTNVADGETVTVGAVVYRFKDVMAQAYDVQIGANADASLGNLVLAVNAAGAEGVNYYAGTLIHPFVSAGAVAAHATTMTLKAAYKGTKGNTIAKAETSAHLSWNAGATFTGGVDLAATITFTAVASTQYFLNLGTTADCKVAITTNANCSIVNNAAIGATNGMPAGSHGLWLYADAGGAGNTVVTLTNLTADGWSGSAPGITAAAYTDASPSKWVELRAMTPLATGDLLAWKK